MKLRDVSLSSTEFFLRKTESSTQDSKKAFWEDFKQIIGCLEKEVEGNTHGQTNYSTLEEAPFRQGQITPILSSPWIKKKSNKFLRRFISRVFLDVFSLQIFLCRFGETTIKNLDNVNRQLLDELSILKEKINRERCRTRETQNNRLKSECLCYWVEFPDDADIEINAERVFTIVFESNAFQEIDFSFARIAFIEVKDELKFCLLVKDVSNSTIFFNDLLPEYFLSWAKVRNEESLLKQKAIESARANLNDLLEQSKHQKLPSLSEIEDMNFKLSGARTAFAEKFLDMQFHLRTLEINISNAEKLLNRQLLHERKELLTELWIKPLKLVAEQTSAYLSYYQIILEKSRITSEKIATETNLKSAIYSRRLAFLFGLFSLIGILQLFPDSFGKMPDHKKIIILSITILIFSIVAFISEIKNWFTKSKS